jgi:hypothetical protein
MDAFARLVRSLVRERVRFVVIGLSGANYYARSGGDLFVTQDRDLYLPLDPANVLAAWKACEAAGCDLLVGREPLDQPRDRRLAERVVATRALVRATNGAGLDVDLTLVMTGFDFDRVWAGRRLFRVDEVEIPVARLRHIVESKRLTGRQKDRLFLAAHADMIRDLMDADRRGTSTGVRKPRRTRQKRAARPRRAR